MIDRRGPSRVVPIAAVIQATALVALVEAIRVGCPVELVAVVALLAGAAEPQVGATLRGLWADLVPDELRGTAVALSSVLFEAPVLVGPLLLTGLLAVGSSAMAVVAGAGCFAAGAWLLARSRAARAWHPRPRSAGRRLGVLRSQAVRTVMVVAAAQGLVTGFVQVAAAATAALQGTPGKAPLLYAALSVGSLLGTLGYGARRWSVAPGRRLTVLLAAVACASAGCAGSSELGWLAVGLFTVGLVLGPVGVSCFGLVEVLAPAGVWIEAFTTVTAAGIAGFAGGTAAAGAIVNQAGPAGGFLAAALVALVTVGMVHARRSTLR